VPDDFSDPPSELVSQHCVAKTLRNRQTKPESGASSLSHTKTQPIPKEAGSFFKNPLKIGVGS
jgi:hypothetical protein